MAISVYFGFGPGAFTRQQYDQVLAGLEAAGAGAPPGRLHHVAFGDDDGLQVWDVWESQEALDAFGETLIPVLQEHGVDPVEPTIATVQNIIG